MGYRLLTAGVLGTAGILLAACGNSAGGGAAASSGGDSTYTAQQAAAIAGFQDGCASESLPGGDNNAHVIGGWSCFSQYGNADFLDTIDSPSNVNSVMGQLEGQGFGCLLVGPSWIAYFTQETTSSTPASQDANTAQSEIGGSIVSDPAMAGGCAQ